MRTSSSRNPWKDTALRNPCSISESKSGKLAGSMSVDVMCQRSKASPHPLQRQSVTSAAERRSATSSACSSVCGSMSPPCGAMTTRPRCMLSPQRRSISSPRAMACPSDRLGSAAGVLATPSEGSSAPRRRRPVSPARTIPGRSSSRTSLTVNRASRPPVRRRRSWLPRRAPSAASRRGSAEQCSECSRRSSCEGKVNSMRASWIMAPPPRRKRDTAVPPAGTFGW